MIPAYIRPQLKEDQFPERMIAAARHRPEHYYVELYTAHDAVFEWLSTNDLNFETEDDVLYDMCKSCCDEQYDARKCIEEIATKAEELFLAEEAVKYQARLSPEAVRRAAAKCGCSAPTEDLLPLLSTLAVFGSLWLEKYRNELCDIGVPVSQLIDIANAYEEPSSQSEFAKNAGGMLLHYIREQRAKVKTLIQDGGNELDICHEQESLRLLESIAIDAGYDMERAVTL